MMLRLRLRYCILHITAMNISKAETGFWINSFDVLQTMKRNFTGVKKSPLINREKKSARNQILQLKSLHHWNFCGSIEKIIKKNKKENKRVNPHSVMAKVLDCDLGVSEFEFQSRYYVQFWTNTLGKCMKPLILPVMGWIVSLLSFY